MATERRRRRQKRSGALAVPPGGSPDRGGPSTENSEEALQPPAAGEALIANTPEEKGKTMPDPVPSWLATMRTITDTHWAPGDGSNPKIVEWLGFIGSTYPNMKSYCDSVVHDDYFSWCGLTVGYCMAKAGIAPVFGSSDTSRFLWAAAWLGWGTPSATPEPGDVLVFDFGGGDHHVTLFESDNGNGTWSCRGGNQSHQVKVTNFPKSKIMGIRRPTAAPAIVQPAELAPAAAKSASQRFADCVALVLHDEGGNDDDPRDPGGRTSRGILQREWDFWRQTHPGLPSDVWQAPQDQVVAIYHEKYWNVLSGDSLPAGVDYVAFDYGVLSGTGRSAKVLQGFVGAEVDGEIGPKTIAAADGADAATLINKISDERLTFMQSLKTWPVFGKGWTKRVEGVRGVALAMVTAAVPSPPAASGSDALAQLRLLIEKVEMMMAGTTTTPPTQSPASVPSQANLAALIEQAFSLVQALNATKSQPATTPPGQAQDTVKQVVDLLTAVLAATSAQPADGSKPLLGQVNGALGQAIGNLLNGKKSAIGIIGSLLTAILQVVGPSVPISTILPFITSSAGLGNLAMPLFLAVTAWGVLGKFEKWAQTSPPVSK